MNITGTRKIDGFINRYPLSKTLRFKLIPQGETEYIFERKGLLAEDETRAEEYTTIKGLMDRYHKDFIERVLASVELSDLPDYAELYLKSSRSEKDDKKLKDIAKAMREQISASFKSKEFKSEYGKLSPEDMIKTNLPALSDLSQQESEALKHFQGFTSYFKSFCDKRKELYGKEGKATQISFRVVNQNLPKFLDNCKTGQQLLSALGQEQLDELENNLLSVLHLNLSDLFEVSFFNRVLTQAGIDTYQQAIGGFTTASGEKVKGINEYINEYRQQTKQKLPLLKPLFKQILSDRSSISFIPEQFHTAQEILNAVSDFYTKPDFDSGLAVREAIDRLTDLFSHVSGYQKGVYIPSASLTELSQRLFDSWHTIQDALNAQYDSENRPQKVKDEEKYLDKRSKYFKAIKSHDVFRLPNTIQDRSLTDEITANVEKLSQAVTEAFLFVQPVLEMSLSPEQKCLSDEEAIAKLKAFLDAIKDYQRFVGCFTGTGTEENKNELFYGEFIPLYEQLNAITPLYNKVRSFVTQKPYSTDKIKLNFGNARLANGWATEKQYSTLMFRQNGLYYLGIIDKKYKSFFDKYEWQAPMQAEDTMEKMFYYFVGQVDKTTLMLMRDENGQVSQPLKDLDEARKNHLPPKIYQLWKTGAYKPGGSISREDLTEFIDYYRWCTIDRYPQFTFYFKKPSEYRSFQEFIKDIDRQGYQIQFKSVSRASIDQFVSEGKLYLFQIYNKDFSPHSKGTPNLHTLYFKMLFDERNLSNTVFALNGGAELFYRKASIKSSEAVVHPANQPIANKNPNSPNSTAVYPYDIVKNRRFIQRHFEFHVPITLNCQAENLNPKDMNLAVRKALKYDKHNYVIGIDRGERNLLYVCVIDETGRIVEQFSLNSIVSNSSGAEQTTDYHALLSKREQERDESRKNWKSIEGIKELKEGYISQAVHQICGLVEKYDAVIAMEDLNSGFKNSRSKVEKSVYQKFEKMLIDKLNFLADKRKQPDEAGGLLGGYQLTNKFESFAKMTRQNGFIFYVPAWLTSKIDPATGFADLIHPKYESVKAAQAFFSKIDRIFFDESTGDFVFDVDYSKFPYAKKTDWKKHWTLTTSGTRIYTHKNKAGYWESESVNLSEQFTAFFDEYGIDRHAKDLKKQILSQNSKAFYVRLIALVKLMLQMRNSIIHGSEDYLYSPVAGANGKHFDSRAYQGRFAPMPIDADANGAYHIARKAQWAIEQLQEADADKLDKVNLSITNENWLKYVQSSKK